MGAGQSQDEASQSRQTREEPSNTRPQYNQETSTEAKHSETKLKTEEKATEARPQTTVQEKAVEVKPLSDAKAKTVKKATLPHNCKAILRDADSLVDRSSVDKDQLRTGVFLNEKRRKYWVEKKRNCFMLFATDLSVTWGGDARYWHWPTIFDASDGIVDLAELKDVCWLEIFGKFNTKMLSPGILYEVVFVIMLKDPAYGWGYPVNVSLDLPNGHTQERTENLITKPREQWIEVPVGEFITSPENAGEMQIGLHERDGGQWKKGLVIKGIVIRPKT